MRSLFLLLAGLAVTAHADTKTYRYRLSEYPKIAAGCHAAAQEVGNKFVTTTGQSIRLASCVKEDADGYLIEVEYEAETPAQLVSTKSATGSLYPVGQYKTRELCDAELTKLSQTFQAQTGLTPAFAYCSRDFFSQSYPWYARLDAFGSTAKPPRVGGFLIFGVPIGYAPGAFGTEIVAALTQLGVFPTHIRTHSGSGYATETVTYYNADRLDFVSRELTRPGIKDECLPQIAATKTELAQLAVKPLIVYCGQDLIGGVQLTAVFPNSAGFKLRSSAETFASFNDCTAGRAALIQKYQVDLKAPVVGGACSRGRRGQYVVSLFEKY